MSQRSYSVAEMRISRRPDAEIQVQKWSSRPDDFLCKLEIVVGTVEYMSDSFPRVTHLRLNSRQGARRSAAESPELHGIMAFTVAASRLCKTSGTQAPNALLSSWDGLVCFWD